MYAMYVEEPGEIAQCTQLFERHFEPRLRQLEDAYAQGLIPSELPEVPEYLQVCRWPFRRLEYEFALGILLENLGPGSAYLDAGSGTTPLAHVIAGLIACRCDACDRNERLIEEIRRVRPERLYGSPVTYTVQDLTSLSYPDRTFDAVSCISVLEHLGAPDDQTALTELLRVLKPGGVLVLTVDFAPADATGGPGKMVYYGRRVLQRARAGGLRAVLSGVGRKWRAVQAAKDGRAHHARSANQCFEIGHLERDITPLLDETTLGCRFGWMHDLRSARSAHASLLWSLGPAMKGNDQRTVLPAGVAARKPAVVSV